MQIRRWWVHGGTSGRDSCSCLGCMSRRGCMLISRVYLLGCMRWGRSGRVHKGVPPTNLARYLPGCMLISRVYPPGCMRWNVRCLIWATRHSPAVPAVAGTASASQGDRDDTANLNTPRYQYRIGSQAHNTPRRVGAAPRRSDTRTRSLARRALADTPRVARAVSLYQRRRKARNT